MSAVRSASKPDTSSNSNRDSNSEFSLSFSGAETSGWQADLAEFMLIARSFRADLLDTFAKNAAEPVHANFGPPFPISIERPIKRLTIRSSPEKKPRRGNTWVLRKDDLGDVDRPGYESDRGRVPAN